MSGPEQDISRLAQQIRNSGVRQEGRIIARRRIDDQQLGLDGSGTTCRMDIRPDLRAGYNEGSVDLGEWSGRRRACGN